MFTNRFQAGEVLAVRLKEAGEELLSELAVITSIPRGGVVIGSALAKTFKLPHDCLVTKKLRAPGQPELAIGAVGKSAQSLYLNQPLIKDLKIDQPYLDKEILNRQEEIRRREVLYRNGRLPLELDGKTVVIADDGAATGATIIAAIREVWEYNPKRVVVALPVCAFDIISLLENEADAVYALITPKLFGALSRFYDDFSQVSDQEVVEILKNL